MDRIFVYGVDGNDHKVHDISDPETGQGYFSDYVGMTATAPNNNRSFRLRMGGRVV